MKKTFLLNKLVRDKSNEIVARNHGTMKARYLGDDEFLYELRRKLTEERDELFKAQDHDEVCAELSDMYEVLDEYAKLYDLTREQITIKQEAKREKRGGLVKRLYIESVTVPVDTQLASYYQEDPERYPEIDE